MAQPYAQVTSMSSAGTSTAISLNPTAKTTVFQLTSITTTSSLDVTIQITLDDPLGSSTVWTGVSTTHYSSTTSLGDAGDGVFITCLSPVAGARIRSTTFSSATGNGLRLAVMQSVTA